MSRARDLADYVSTGVTSDELNLLDGSDTGPLSHRNMVINGGMTVAQRGTGFSAIHGDQYASDAFKFDCGSEDELRLSITRENSGPTGFSHSVRLNVTTAESAIASDEYARIATTIESQDLQHLDYGASGAKTTTISFWVKASLTGTYAIQMYQFDGTQNIGTTYTINVADTWEKKTVTFVGNTAQAITNDNTAGIRLNWILMVGSDYTGTDNSSWGSYSGGRFGNGHTANWGTNTSHDFWLSGVQWEIGSVATPFEHRSYGEELARCQRYYQNSYRLGEVPSTSTPNHTDGQYMTRWNDGNVTGPRWTVAMRAAPSVTIRGYGSNTTGQVKVNGGSFITNSSAQAISHQSCAYINIDDSTGAVWAHYCWEAFAEL